MKNLSESSRPVDEEFESIIESDRLNFENFSIESLNSIKSLNTNDNFLKFKKKYEAITENIENLAENTILYGNINHVFENPEGGWITNIIIKEDVLIASSKDGSIKIYDLNDNIILTELDDAHDGEPIYSLLLFKEENLIISGGDDCQIKFWDNDYDEIESIENGSEVYHMIKSEYILIVANEDATINFYDLHSNFLVNKITTDHESPICKLLLLDSNDILLSGSWDSKIKVWNIKYTTTEGDFNNDCISTIDFHEGSIDSLIQLEFDNNILVSADHYGTIVFSSIFSRYQIIKKCEISQYNNCNYECEDLINYDNFTHLYELKKYKMLISIARGSSLLFWNLQDYQIIRNVKFYSNLSIISGLENEEGIVFSQDKNIVIWK